MLESTGSDGILAIGTVDSYGQAVKTKEKGSSQQASFLTIIKMGQKDTTSAPKCHTSRGAGAIKG